VISNPIFETQNEDFKSLIVKKSLIGSFTGFVPKFTSVQLQKSPNYPQNISLDTFV